MPRADLIERAQAIQSDVSQRLVDDGAERAIVVRAGAGAGKSGLVTAAAGAAARAELRVAICAPTNEQVFDLVRRIATSLPKTPVTHYRKKDLDVPDEVLALPNVISTDDVAQANDGDALVIATLDKVGHAATKLYPFDRLIIDEAYQADSTKYLCVAGLADRHLLVGDSGQLNPFSTVDCSQWRGLPEDPLQTAVGVLLRNHGATTPVIPLPLTRRLPPSAVGVVQPAFYGAGLPFQAATLPGERELAFDRAAARKTSIARQIDAAIDHAASRGWAHLQLPSTAVLVADPETVEAIVALVRTVFERRARARCEKHPKTRALNQGDVAIAVSHNDQKDLLRVALASANLGGVTVDTANKLQGLEYELVVAWHPLAGLPDLDEFHLDPGRLCVMLTRHRHACIVVGRQSDRELVEYQPPTTPAFLGWDPDPVLDGWEAHRHVFEQLEPHVV